MGLLERRPGYYRAKITLTVAAYAGGWVLFVMAGNSWTALAVAPLLGVLFTQLGFIGHDAGHNQVFGTRRRNRILGLAVGNALIGLSFGWWVPKHNAHHAHPNEIGRDPDIGEAAPLASADAPGNRPGPLASLAGALAGTHVLPPHAAAQQRHARPGHQTAVASAETTPSAAEAALLLLHAALYLTVVLWVLSPLKALAFIAVQQGVFSVYLGISFAPNHKAMPIIEPATCAGFARRQVSTARNITGGPLTTFILGGLNRQIEHHLFPSMPRPNLPRVQHLVRDFCAATDLGYSEENFAESFRQIIHHLSDTATAAGRRAEPAAAR